MTSQFDAMVAGHVCLDIIPRFPSGGHTTFAELLRPGTLVRVDGVTVGTGGPVSNTGIGMKKLGAKVCFCARVGNDDFGEMVMRHLQGSGSAEGVRVVDGCETSYTVALAPPGIDRVFIHNPGSNDSFVSEDLDPDLISRCRHFHFGYPPLMKNMYDNGGAELERVFRIAKDTGATTSLDMALPDPSSEAGRADWKSILQRVLPFVDIFLPSFEEILYMLEPDNHERLKRKHPNEDLIDVLSPDDCARLADELLDMGVAMTSLKAGHRGIYFRTGSKDAIRRMGRAEPSDIDNWSNRELWCPALEVQNLAGATGSGDSAIAGFLTAFLRGESIETCLKVATCAGWQNVQVLDATSGIRGWDETSELVGSGMPVMDVGIESDKWRLEPESGVWVGVR